MRRSSTHPPLPHPLDPLLHAKPSCLPRVMMSIEEFGGQGAPGEIQPREHCHWECNNVVFPTSHDPRGGSFSLTEPLLDCQCVAAADGLELGDFVEHVVKQLSDVSPESFSSGSLSAGNTHRNDASYCYGRREELRQECVASQQAIRKLVTADQGGEVVEGDEHVVRLLTVLLDCAVSISVDDLPAANRMLLELTHVASPYSPSCAERLVAYFAQAMASRVMNSWLGICTPLVDHKTNLLGELQVFSNIAPFVKFAHFTANQAIVEALQRWDSVHIVDLDAMQGLQWSALLHALAVRASGPPRVRMTALGVTADVLAETGRRLCDVARRLGVSFEFRAVAKKAGDVDPAVVRTRSGEAAAVHWLRHTLYDATGPDRGTMRLLELIAPRVITLVEPEVVQAGPFLDRFARSLHHYAAMFDTLGASLPPEDRSRHRVESCLLAREVKNMLAVGGPARTGEEKFASWRVELARHGGFAQVPISPNAMAQAQVVLSNFPPPHGYTLHHGDGTLGLGWKDTRLYTASAWTWPVSQSPSLPLIRAELLKE